MPKVTIYLPEALHAAVKAVEITVSPICQEALRKEVKRMKMIEQADDDIRAVANRLRKSMDEAEEGRFDLGIRYGMDWASDDAEWEALVGFVNFVTTENWITISEESINWYLGEGEDPELRDVVFGERNNFTYGFIEGAKRVYDKVLPLMGG